MYLHNIIITSIMYVWYNIITFNIWTYKSQVKSVKSLRYIASSIDFKWL